MVTLHGASDGRARQPLFDHLARILAPLGIAVLSYDRRPAPGDTPLDVQAADAVAAMHSVREQLNCPVGLFGFSQGAWAATIAAADPITPFLILLGCSGVTPAAQMRYYTDELLRRRRFDVHDRQRLGELRIDFENYLRRSADDPGLRDDLDARLSAAQTEPWFEHAYLPKAAPAGDQRWTDMDYDPTPSLDRICSPVLALWGSDEECVPLQASVDAWRASSAEVTITELPGCGHWPVIGSGSPDYNQSDEDQFSEHFELAITGWLTRLLDPPVSASP
jgi:uncharacterized protein